MIKISFFLFFILFSGCSLKTPPNEWQYKSATAFNSYTQDFLADNETLAKNDLARAIKHAKKSADLTQLAKIYLGKCALNISVGINDNCKEYANISDLVNDNMLNAYYNFIHLSLKKEQIKYLPKNYHSFAKNLMKKDFKNANEAIFNMPKATSSFLCASLIKDNITPGSRQKILNLASYYGYKKLVLFWLRESIKRSANQDKIKKLRKKIFILQSNN